MKPTAQGAATIGEWRDGFIFIGNQLIVDFVNTRPAVDGEPVELLPDAPALARWLVAAGLCGASLIEEWGGVRSKEFVKEMERLREFREVARSGLFRLERGSNASPDFVKCVNGHLRDHPTVSHLSMHEGRLLKETLFAPKRPSDAFAPLAEDAAQLLTDRDPQRLRKCSSCALHFLDTSKKGTRRWCSMAMCGNRSKVAAYARRAGLTRD
jgi:predicted RNA-binding Zn ribbon-like protein